MNLPFRNTLACDIAAFTKFNDAIHRRDKILLVTKNPKRGPRVGRTVVLSIRALSAAGEGVGFVAACPILVRGTIPGELVRVAITKRGGKASRGRLQEILRPCRDRIVPRCRHFGPCARCALQHVEYAAQLRLKSRLLHDVLRQRLDSRQLPLRPVISNDSAFETRHKADFLVSFVNGQYVPGHCQAETGHHLPIEECPVHHPTANRVAFAICNAINRAGPPDRQRFDHLIVRVSSLDQRAMAVLVTTTQLQRADADAPPLPCPDVDLPTMRRLGQIAVVADPAIAGMHWNINRRPGPAVLGDETIYLAGESRLTESVAGVQFSLSPTAFFQTNPLAARRLVETVLRFVPPGSSNTVMDLYAGVGLFSLALAKQGHRVLAVEENRAAVADAEASQLLNQIDGCRWNCGDVAAFMTHGIPDHSSPDVMILDPPRAGCAKTVADAIVGPWRPRSLVYISCEPRALARDLAFFVASGYRIREIQPIDMFPQTMHLETVVLLETS